MKKIKKKKSTGTDGLSQEQMLLGTKNLADPLLDIINDSIDTGYFPDDWKQALITPVLKKGNAEVLENFIQLKKKSKNTWLLSHYKLQISNLKFKFPYIYHYKSIYT